MWTFSDYQDQAPFGSVGTPSDGCGAGDGFVTTTVATGLDRSVPQGQAPHGSPTVRATTSSRSTSTGPGTHRYELGGLLPLLRGHAHEPHGRLAALPGSGQCRYRARHAGPRVLDRQREPHVLHRRARGRPVGFADRLARPGERRQRRALPPARHEQRSLPVRYRHAHRPRHRRGLRLGDAGRRPGDVLRERRPQRGVQPRPDVERPDDRGRRRVPGSRHRRKSPR